MAVRCAERAWLAFMLRDDWSAGRYLAASFVCIEHGRLVTLLFNVLVTSSPKEVAGDVGSCVGRPITLRPRSGLSRGRVVGRATSAICTAYSATRMRLSCRRRLISTASTSLATTVGKRYWPADASPAQVAEAVRVNTESRLRALESSARSWPAWLRSDPSGRTPAQLPSGEIAE